LPKNSSFQKSKNMLSSIKTQRTNVRQTDRHPYWTWTQVTFLNSSLASLNCEISDFTKEFYQFKINYLVDSQRIWKRIGVVITIRWWHFPQRLSWYSIEKVRSVFSSRPKKVNQLSFLTVSRPCFVSAFLPYQNFLHPWFSKSGGRSISNALLELGTVALGTAPTGVWGTGKGPGVPGVPSKSHN